MAAPVLTPLFDDIASLTASFKEVMVSGSGPIAPRLSEEQIEGIFSYAKIHYEEISVKNDGLYHLRPSETGLARSVTWMKDESGIDFLVHCNKLHTETGGDTPLCSDPVHSEKQLSYAFSSLDRMLVVSGAIKCFITCAVKPVPSGAGYKAQINLSMTC